MSVWNNILLHLNSNLKISVCKHLLLFYRCETKQKISACIRLNSSAYKNLTSTLYEVKVEQLIEEAEKVEKCLWKTRAP